MSIVLNDPKKRETYDKYGTVDLEGLDFEEFMGSFGKYDDFLTEILSVLLLTM
jgi:DnaJ-class molecular chaperone